MTAYRPAGTEVTSSRDSVRPLVVSVEGNIGCGKSTFLEYCSVKPGVDVYPEPIARWTNVDGVNLLAKFYENPRQWAMPFQLWVSMTVLDIYKARSWRPLKLVERSLLSARHCFMENMRRQRILEPAMCSVLEGWYDRADEDLRSNPHAIVYLRTTPSVAFQRVRARARGEEGAVSLVYLEQLHERHEEWIGGLEAANMQRLLDMPIYVINADQSLDQIYSQFEACLQFMDTLNA